MYGEGKGEKEGWKSRDMSLSDWIHLEDDVDNQEKRQQEGSQSGRVS